MRRLMLSAALLAVFGGLESSAYVHPHPVAQFTARSMEFASPARLEFRRVDVVITDWSTGPDHRELVRALIDKGPRAFFDALCGYPSRGTVSVAAGPTFTIRYAWQVSEADGGRRVFVATDEPMFVGNIRAGRPYVEPLVFLELRVDRTGHGLGKLSEADHLAANESSDVIELRDFEGQPADLIVEESH
jgi:hypothetical protein